MVTVTVYDRVQRKQWSKAFELPQAKRFVRRCKYGNKLIVTCIQCESMEENDEF